MDDESKLLHCVSVTDEHSVLTSNPLASDIAVFLQAERATETKIIVYNQFLCVFIGSEVKFYLHSFILRPRVY